MGKVVYLCDLIRRKRLPSRAWPYSSRLLSAAKVRPRLRTIIQTQNTLHIRTDFFWYVNRTGATAIQLRAFFEALQRNSEASLNAETVPESTIVRCTGSALSTFKLCSRRKLLHAIDARRRRRIGSLLVRE